MADEAKASTLENCKLTYFDLAGRGESIRLALTAAKIKFTDERVAFKDWPALKPSTPWGQLPVLTLACGTALAQESACLRLVGKHTGLYPADQLAAGRVDELLGVFDDINQNINNTGRGLEKAEKEAKRLETVSKGGDVYALLEKVDASLGTHGADGFAVGSTLTTADLVVYAYTGFFASGWYDGVPKNYITPFANIQAVRKTVATLPEIVAYIDTQADPAYDSFKEARAL
eukprot:CAMPEP_0205818434 /NCGR_PEP_ID=MMETSP0206-20130828/345_1 /ASSEMBLY_ACC=CAM_ASM_000279 /TAXON_ID=36767 /ORGANISM="Euplotes focardii, Strain TN1" /LENGTH=230 /DNA_ID=CAMNT_0053110793 /DNA_START=31 /DNA_END=723 /DNA_ORIENTATION=+